MRLGVLKSIGHNLADSLASGIGLMIGVYDLDVFAEAARQEPGFIEIDFLSGEMCGSPASESLTRAVNLYMAALPGLCIKQGATVGDFARLRARFGTDSIVGPYFRVCLEDSLGHTSDEIFIGSPGRRFRQRRTKRDALTSNA